MIRMRLFNKITIQIACSFLLFAGLSMAQSEAGEQLDHREDFEMESVSGGDFRSYVSDHIREDNRWAYSMTTLGSFHNLMHEMMSHIARHGKEERNENHIPDFGQRISGGEWTEIREGLEQEENQSAWHELVQITEIMHDRVHHAMSKSILYDQEINQREADPADYLRTKPMDPEIAIPGTDQLNYNFMSQNEFREMVWKYDIDEDYKHASFQSMAIFNHMLYDLLNQWADVGSDHEDPACRPPENSASQTNESWTEYASEVKDCGDQTWAELVMISNLMKNRIHHMMYKLSGI